jgi:hypothetical protein
MLGERMPSRPADATAAPQELAQLVSHGGLILLHPFLPQLFEQTAVTTAGARPLEPAVLPRAAALLYLLATGGAEAYEFELGFIKVLLGVPLHEPLLVADGLLGARDHEEVDALLHAVIAHWSALGGTSPEGLRSAFLQRPALLHQAADGWRLRVQWHAIDVLLDHLPWSIGVARLPWMAQPIFAEWQAR